MTVRKKKTIDERFDAVDERFNAVDERFNAVDEQFAEFRERFAAVDQRFEAVDRRFDGIDQRVDSLERRVTIEGETSRRHMDVIAEELKGLLCLSLDRQMATVQQITGLAAAHAANHVVYTVAIQDHETRLRILEQQHSAADQQG